MSGPSNNDREALGKRVRLRQILAEIFGWLVGVGLLVEYWDEIGDCIVNRHWPSQPLFGGILVTAGVFLEVLLSRLALITSDELQKRGDSDVAQANKSAALALDRATKAEQATAEANLERAKLEAALKRRTISRDLTEAEAESVVASASKYSGQKFIIQIKFVEGVSSEQESEQAHLMIRLAGLLRAAQWQSVTAPHLSDLGRNVGVTILRPDPFKALGEFVGETHPLIAGQALYFALRKLFSCEIDHHSRERDLVIIVVGTL